MSSHIADPVFPFKSRVGETHAVFPGGIINDSLAPFTLIDDGVAGASVELASSFGHEDAFLAFSYRCTNHGYHILSIRILKRSYALFLLVVQRRMRVYDSMFLLSRKKCRGNVAQMITIFFVLSSFSDPIFLPLAVGLRRGDRPLGRRVGTKLLQHNPARREGDALCVTGYRKPYDLAVINILRSIYPFTFAEGNCISWLSSGKTRRKYPENPRKPVLK